MSKNTEELLPISILKKAIRSGNEFGWKIEDIPSVINACKECDFAIQGGQAEFILPDGTCDLYWISIDTVRKKVEEDWKTYSQRTCNESLQMFEKLVHRYDFEKEGIESFKFLYDRKNEGFDISEYLCFVLYPVTEDEYYKLRLENNKIL